MSSYSLAGYTVALLLRGKKTILVEGVSDANLIRHYFVKKNIDNQNPRTCLVDDVGIVKDESLSGMGCRVKVQAVAAHVGTSDKINWLYDREWDGVDFESFTISAVQEPENGKGYQTLGHSIENYWIKQDVIKDYLLMAFSSELPHTFFDEFSQRFHQMLLLAVAFSFAARRLSVITRCSGLIQANDVEWTGVKYILMQSLSSKLLLRGGVANFSAEVDAELAREGLNSMAVHDLQLLAHGHLGEELLWSCCAHLAQSFGADNKIIECIERGRKVEKIAHHTHLLTTHDSALLHPIDRLYQWAA